MKQIILMACLLCTCISVSIAQTKTTLTPEQSTHTVELEKIDKQLIELKTEYVNSNNPDILAQYQELSKKRNELTGIKPVQKNVKTEPKKRNVVINPTQIKIKSPKSEKL